jgi:hypothetical protein
MIPEPSHPNTLPHQPGITLSVTSRLQMLSTIKLHRQLQLVAVEIQHVNTARHLTPKLQTEESAIPQMPPQPGLSVGLPSPQLPRELHLIHGSLLLSINLEESSAILLRSAAGRGVNMPAKKPSPTKKRPARMRAKRGYLSATQLA